MLLLHTVLSGHVLIVMGEKMCITGVWAYKGDQYSYATACTSSSVENNLVLNQTLLVEKVFPA